MVEAIEIHFERVGVTAGAAMAPAAHRIPAYKAAAPGSAAQRMAAYKAAAPSAEPGITFLRRGPIFQAAAPAHAPKPSAPRRIPAAKVWNLYKNTCTRQSDIHDANLRHDFGQVSLIQGKCAILRNT